MHFHKFVTSVDIRTDSTTALKKEINTIDNFISTPAYGIERIGINLISFYQNI